MGSSRPARLAGYMPKNTPMIVESSIASTGAHTGKEDGSGVNRASVHEIA
jgi:hypothetical protein